MEDEDYWKRITAEAQSSERDAELGLWKGIQNRFVRGIGYLETL